MNVLTSILLPFLVTWLVYFVAIYALVEFGQNYLYDETTPGAGLKVAIASFVLALVQAWARTSFDTMFTSELPKTMLQGIVWFVVFTLVLRFHPPHAFGIGLVAMLLLAGASTLVSNSMLQVGPGAVPSRSEPRKPVRRSFSSPTTPTAPAEPASEIISPAGPEAAK
jgi:hypothetical protein